MSPFLGFSAKLCVPTCRSSMGNCLCCCRKKVADETDPVFVDSKDRKCTDVFCCLLFIGFWIGMIVIAAIAFSLGNPNRLFLGSDYQGRVCGSNGTNGTLLYYPRITQDIVNFYLSGDKDPLDITLFGVCLDKCPIAGDTVCTQNGTDAVATVQSLLSPATTNAGDTLAACDLDSGYINTNLDIVSNCAIVRQNCWGVPLNTTDYLNRCIWTGTSLSSKDNICLSPPSLANQTQAALEAAGTWSQCITSQSTIVSVTTGQAQSNPELNLLVSSAAEFGRFLSDIKKALPVIIVCGAGFSFLLGFVWLVFVKWFGGFLVWLTVWATLAITIIVTIISYFKAGILTKALIQSELNLFDNKTGYNITVSSLALPSLITSQSTNLEKQWAYFAYAMTAFTFILFVIVLWMRKNIAIAIAIIKEASSALQSMKSLFFYPIFTFLLLAILMIYWIFVASYLASAGASSVSTAAAVSSSQFLNSTQNLLCGHFSNGTVIVGNKTCDSLLAAIKFNPSNAKRFALIYHLFGLLWTNAFISGFGIMVVSGAIGKWYFTVDKSKDLPRLPCCASAGRTLRYHMGSIAFGSLLIAIVQMIRVIMAYLDNKTKSAQNNNRVLKVLFKVVECCLWCFEKCLKFISKYAYIVVAMKGKSFCPAAAQAIGIMVTHVGELAVVETITSLLFVLGKLLIVGISALLGFAWFDKAKAYQPGGKDELSSMLIPLALLVLLAYAVATTFLSIYHLAIETILVCYCEDLKQGKGTAESPYYMSDNLKRVIGASMAKPKTASGDDGPVALKGSSGYEGNQEGKDATEVTVA